MKGCRRRGQALRDRPVEGRDPVDEAGLQTEEVVPLQVLGTGLAGIATRQVDAPEIVVAERTKGHDAVEARPKEAGEPSRVIVDHSSLRAGYSQEREDARAPDETQETVSEQGPAHLGVVEAKLLLDALGVENPVHRLSYSSPVVDPELHGEGNQAGGAAVVEAPTKRCVRLKEADLVVPELRAPDQATPAAARGRCRGRLLIHPHRTGRRRRRSRGHECPRASAPGGGSGAGSRPPPGPRPR